MEILLLMFGAMLCGMLAYVAVNSLWWFRFRWRVLGCRRAILSEEALSRTVAEYAASAVAELDGRTLSDEQKCQRLERLFRDAICSYVRDFSVHR